MDPLISTVLLADDSRRETEQGFLWYCVISTAQDHAEGKKKCPLSFWHRAVADQSSTVCFC